MANSWLQTVLRTNQSSSTNSLWFWLFDDDKIKETRSRYQSTERWSDAKVCVLYIYRCVWTHVWTVMDDEFSFPFDSNRLPRCPNLILLIVFFCCSKFEQNQKKNSNKLVSNILVNQYFWMHRQFLFGGNAQMLMHIEHQPKRYESSYLCV